MFPLTPKAILKFDDAGVYERFCIWSVKLTLRSLIIMRGSDIVTISANLRALYETSAIVTKSVNIEPTLDL